MLKKTPHIEVCEEGKIAKIVLMPGDPLRAEYIAGFWNGNAKYWNIFI